MEDSNKQLIVALVKAQLEIQAPKKDKSNAHFKSKYCSLDSIYEAVRIPLANNGLILSHTVNVVEGSHVVISTLFHISGAQISNQIPLLIGKLDSQGLGSAMTYSRKLAVCSLLALPTEEDDDGNAAVTQTVPQRAEEYISLMDADKIEDSLLSEDPQFRSDLLKYFTTQCKLTNEMADFNKLPMRFLPMILKAIQKRKDAGSGDR